MMTQKINLIAKPVVKNKFWIVEREGEKIATIQAIEDGGFAYVDNLARKKYPSIKLLTTEHNIIFDKQSNESITKLGNDYTVYGYPADTKPYNILWEVKHQFPVYTKSQKSKSFFCAGWYMIKLGQSWVKSFCPKFITLERYPFRGPYKHEEQIFEIHKEIV